jgi:hypothetical protein
MKATIFSQVLWHDSVTNILTQRNRRENNALLNVFNNNAVTSFSKQLRVEQNTENESTFKGENWPLIMTRVVA